MIYVLRGCWYSLLNHIMIVLTMTIITMFPWFELGCAERLTRSLALGIRTDHELICHIDLEVDGYPLLAFDEFCCFVCC